LTHSGHQQLKFAVAGINRRVARVMVRILFSDKSEAARVKKLSSVECKQERSDENRPYQ
jgi:hypothetical protein